MNKKPFYQSKTFWGLVITALGIYAPRYATFLQGSLDDIITLVGLVTALYGRWTATRPLAAQPVPERAGRPILLLLALPLLAVQASAQNNVYVTADKYEADKLKITATFTNLNVAFQNLPGANLSLDYKLGRYGKWRLGGVVDGGYYYDTNRRLDRFQFLGGPQLSYSVGSVGDDRLSIFGRGLFGATRFDVKTSGQDFARVTVSAGGGVDVHFGRFFIRPAQFDFQWIDERPVRYTRFSAGGGFRF